MDYISLNDQQKRRMNDLIRSPVKMEWEDTFIMDTLLGELPKIRSTVYDNNVSDELKDLQVLFAHYNSFTSNKLQFLTALKEIESAIYNKESRWYGISYPDVEEKLKQQTCCLISGEGGIGKSYFIKCFEEKLKEKGIPHLCMYGKFEKDTEKVDVDNIVDSSEQGFVFAVDAINEMSQSGQSSLLELLKTLRKYPTIRIVLTYRTNAIDNSILCDFTNLAATTYPFPGVSFESALAEILKLAVPDVYKYEDILFSNNALWLSMLCDTLSDKKLVNESINSVTSVTFILEHYVKNAVQRTFKGVDSAQTWRNVKRIAEWMYRNNRNDIDENIALQIIGSSDEFLSMMMQLGIINDMDYDGVHRYYFAIDSLTDYLIARSLFNDISAKDFDTQVSIIKNKMDAPYSRHEAFILVIFDNMAPDYESIYKLLEATGLMQIIQLDTLLKVNFRKENIPSFLTVFKPINQERLLLTFGGYTDKPFNCTNYLNQYYSGKKQLLELSNTLAGTLFLGTVKMRLSNILYFITLNDSSSRRYEEAFYFAKWCCSAPNRDIRNLSTKILYEISCLDVEYIEKLIMQYHSVIDPYIKESFIFVLANMPRENEKILRFFNSLIAGKELLSGNSIKRISCYIGKKYGYIEWQKPNEYIYDPNAEISESLNMMLVRVDLLEKHFLPFRYWGKDNINFYRQFINNNKLEINDINSKLIEKFSCVKNGWCSGWPGLEKNVQKRVFPNIVICKLDNKSYINSFETVFLNQMEIYGMKADEKFLNFSEREFANSTARKILDIAKGEYCGSLMCNYYTNQFGSFNNFQDSLGFEVYDPLEYGDELNLNAPLSTYNSLIERLGDMLVNRLRIPNKKDIVWARDVKNTRENLLSLFQPITDGATEWIPIAGQISIAGYAGEDVAWKDTYDFWCCTSDEETITKNGARYLTIELDEYCGNIADYFQCPNKPWCCKSVKPISSQSDVFEDTSLVLPPAEIISFLKLHFCASDSSWITEEGEKIIICNNNKYAYFHDPVGGTVFIKKEFFEKYAAKNVIKFFAFTERFLPKTGYADETAIHFEIKNGMILREELSCNQESDNPEEENLQCKNCPYGFNDSDTNREDEEYLKIIERYYPIHEI